MGSGEINVNHIHSQNFERLTHTRHVHQPNHRLTIAFLFDSRASVDDRQFYQELGRRIATRRGRLGITQAEVGQRLAVSRASVANIEAGRQKLYVHQLYALARALRLPDLSGILPIAVPADEDAALVGKRPDVSIVQHAQIESLLRNAVAAARPKSRTS